MKTLLCLAAQTAASLRGYFSKILCSLTAKPWGRMLILPLLLLLLITPATAASAQSATLSPREVVEYALTLEKLEADFYRHAVVAIQSAD